MSMEILVDGKSHSLSSSSQNKVHKYICIIAASEGDVHISPLAVISSETLVQTF